MIGVGPVPSSPEVVVVGAGVAGAALAVVLARAGREVLLLERQPAFRDVVRGEIIAAWGVAELERLGLTADVMAAGGNRVRRYIGYDEAYAPEEVFPRGGGRARLYLMHPVELRSRFAGQHREADFLAACRFRCNPFGDAVAAARPAGPCAFFPMTDAWVDPCAPGVVLVGDAAGWNDPIIGQGLSIALRDARMVAEVLGSTADWSPGEFGGYVEERRERLRRLRFTARLATELQAVPDPAAPARQPGVRRAHAHRPCPGRPAPRRPARAGAGARRVVHQGHVRPHLGAGVGLRVRSRSGSGGACG